jgi:hypothetical protein
MRLTPEEWRAYSLNFGHRSPMPTFTSYGAVTPHRQAEILNALAEPRSDETDEAPQRVKLDDDQVNQLAKSREDA